MTRTRLGYGNLVYSTGGLALGTDPSHNHPATTMHSQKWGLPRRNIDGATAIFRASTGPRTYETSKTSDVRQGYGRADVDEKGRKPSVVDS